MAAVDDLAAEVSAHRASIDALKVRVADLENRPEDPRIAQAVSDLAAQRAEIDAIAVPAPPAEG